MMDDSRLCDHENGRTRNETDPVLLMLGVGKELWEAESGNLLSKASGRKHPPPVGRSVTIAMAVVNSARELTTDR
jgi:hypothetical protein